MHRWIHCPKCKTQWKSVDRTIIDCSCGVRITVNLVVLSHCIGSILKLDTIKEN